MNIAIITGASSGLGRGYALECDKRGEVDEIYLIARRQDKLESVAKEMKTKTRILSLDLTKESDIEKFTLLLEKEKPSIKLLINAAGCGRIGRCDTLSYQEQLMMIDLNDKALVAVTTISLKYMDRGSRIMEICSASAFQPVPYVAVYAATKAFAYSYSRALGNELKSRGISVTAVCPYWIKDTEFIAVAEKGDRSSIKSYPFSTTQKKVVSSSFKATYKRRKVSTPGVFPTLHHFLSKILPSSLLMGVWNLLRK